MHGMLRMRRAAAAAAFALAVLCAGADGGGAAAEAESAGPRRMTAERRALGAIEDMRAEIARLAALRDAQAALLEWNRARAAAGAPPEALSGELCREAGIAPWCPLLPTTFGTTGIPGKGEP